MTTDNLAIKFDKYQELKKDIHDYFGYVEDWVSIPLEDAREYYWKLIQYEKGDGYVNFALIEKDVLDEDGEMYQNEIYTQRFLKQWVYRKEDYTMICVDTHTDGNRYLQIFNNRKEVK